MSILRLCEKVRDNSHCCRTTLLQQDECSRLLAAHARGDEEEVERLSEQVRTHFKQLNSDFGEAIEGQLATFAVGHMLVSVLSNEHSAPKFMDTTLLQNNLVASYGTTDQQIKAADRMSGYTLDSLAEWRKSIERRSFSELCLDQEYATRRLKAAASGLSLTKDLMHAREWGHLKSILDHDEAVCRKLIPWLLQVDSSFKEILAPAKERIEAHIEYLRSVAENPPEPDAPPPPYSIVDPNPSPPSAGMFSIVGMDRIRVSLGSLINWTRGE